MDSNLIIDAEFVEPSNAASNVPIHWIECALSALLVLTGPLLLTDQMLINSSLELDPEQRKNYSPSDEKAPDWVFSTARCGRLWPSLFRGCVFLRIIAKTATLCVIREELQHPDVPHARATTMAWAVLAWCMVQPNAGEARPTRLRLNSQTSCTLSLRRRTRTPTERHTAKPSRFKSLKEAAPYDDSLARLVRAALSTQPTVTSNSPSTSQNRHLIARR